MLIFVPTPYYMALLDFRCNLLPFIASVQIIRILLMILNRWALPESEARSTPYTAIDERKDRHSGSTKHYHWRTDGQNGRIICIPYTPIGDWEVKKRFKSFLTYISRPSKLSKHPTPGFQQEKGNLLFEFDFWFVRQPLEYYIVSVIRANIATGSKHPHSSS